MAGGGCGVNPNGRAWFQDCDVDHSRPRHPRVQRVSVSTEEHDEYRESDTGPQKVVPSDAIVIERGELPEVIANESHISVGGSGWPIATAYRQAAYIRGEILENLALVEYIDSHPRIDDAEVKRVADLVMEIVSAAPNPDGSLLADDGATKLARRLVAKGVRVVQP